MRLTTLLEVLRTLEIRERNVVSDSKFVVGGARRNADALKNAREIIDSSAVTELLAPPELVPAIGRVRCKFLAECSRQHNCYASPEPCNGFPKTTLVASTCTCADGGICEGTSLSHCSRCGFQLRRRT